MDPQMVVDIMEQSFWVALQLSIPALLAALLVGVAVSVFQAVTSIQEQTLAFVPKMLAVMLALVVFFGRKSGARSPAFAGVFLRKCRTVIIRGGQSSDYWQGKVVQREERVRFYRTRRRWCGSIRPPRRHSD
jgi:flagellar biosynthetic protein FliQ